MHLSLLRLCVMCGSDNLYEHCSLIYAELRHLCLFLDLELNASGLDMARSEENIFLTKDAAHQFI